MMPLIQVLLLVGIPGLALLAARHVKPVAWVGPVVACYAAGILLANVPGLGLTSGVSLSVSEAAVPLAIPLLLFTTDMPRWMRLARTTLLSFVLACVSAMVSAALVGLAVAERSDEWWKMAGMLTGVFTGGTANMNAVGLALGVREETFVLLNTADIVVGAVYLLFLMTVAQRLALLVLPRFQNATAWEDAEAREEGAPSRRTWAQVRGGVLSLLLAVAVAGVSAGVSLALLGRLEVTVVLLLITTLSLAASFRPSVRTLPGSYALGDYALLVFCVAVGTLADASRLQEAGLFVFACCAAVLVLAVLLHFCLGALFRIDADTVLITSTATIFGPAFIGPVARALRNRELMVSGVTTGIMGFALGTYLGLAVAWFLRP
ncbi:DUF819 family protein [Corallococcus macrosporus]|uniref:DUF819 family protein n=1 Tax=Myxococcus fulvus (strain ATCC BAA-855 / HW-1) TaxID=483219 RepID=F8CDK7_MYXFH|nr:DUF819 family protein [Corallococcus macrosporus]AEI68497.1 hypothetical protein LILAB_33080 [Corallococcus macrosporus]